MMSTSLAVAVAPRICKIIKNGPHGFERGENLLQNGVLHFWKRRKFATKWCITLCIKVKSSEIMLRSKTDL